MFREGNSLLRVGVSMMALALMIAVAVVRATAGSEPGRAVAEEVASKSVREALRPSPFPVPAM